MNLTVGFPINGFLRSKQCMLAATIDTKEGIFIVIHSMVRLYFSLFLKILKMYLLV